MLPPAQEVENHLLAPLCPVTEDGHGGLYLPGHGTGSLHGLELITA